MLADFEFPFDDYLLVILHGVTIEDKAANAAVAAALVQVLTERLGNALVVHTSNDPVSDAIRSSYEALADDPRLWVLPSLRFEAFLTLLRNSRMLVGDPSARIREAQSYRVPSVYIGSRQRGCAHLPTIVRTGTSAANIRGGIDDAGDLERGAASLRFGFGGSARRFAELLAADDIWDRGVDKIFCDLLSSDD